MSNKALLFGAAALGLLALSRRPKKNAPRPTPKLPVGGWTAAPAASVPASPRTPTRTNPPAPRRTNP